MTDYTYAIGDIHGRFDLLQDLMAKIVVHQSNVGAEKVKVIFLGDYVDRGPQSAQVVEYLRTRVNADDWQDIFLKGNHEDMMVNVEDFWIPNGGDATIQSYQDYHPDWWEEYMAKDAEWMHGLPLIHWDDHRIYVHAAVDENATLGDPTPEMNLWARYDKSEDQPAHGRHIVHGHTPQRGGKPLLLTNRTNIDTGAVFKGGALTAAVFKDNQPGGPVAILQSWSE